MEKLEIYFDGLSPETQQQVLDFYKLKSADEGNFGLVPLFTLEYEELNEEEEG